MMKKLILIILCAFILGGCSVFNFVDDVFYEQVKMVEKTTNSIENAMGGYIFEDGTLTVRRNTEQGINDRMPWDSISSAVKTIVVEEGVTELCEFMFEGCDECESITLPQSLQIIDSYAFCGCYKLKNIELPEGLQLIYYNAFSTCGIEKIHIPASVEIIGESVFYDSVNLKEIVIDEKNPYYSSCGCNVVYDIQNKIVISGCSTSLIPEGTEIINKFALSFIPLKEVTIPATVKEIDDFAFCGCEFETVIIPSSVTHIGSYAFDFCDSLKCVEFEFGSDTLFLADNCFMDCGSLTSINLNGRPVKGTFEYLGSNIEILY